jgi:hypothetical protein
MSNMLQDSADYAVADNLTRREHVELALKAANEADQTYSDLIVELYGPKATRWTISAKQAIHPRINVALKAKLDADAQFLIAIQVSRVQKHDWHLPIVRDVPGPGDGSGIPGVPAVAERRGLPGVRER